MKNRISALKSRLKSSVMAIALTFSAVSSYAGDIIKPDLNDPFRVERNPANAHWIIAEGDELISVDNVTGAETTLVNGPVDALSIGLNDEIIFISGKTLRRIGSGGGQPTTIVGNIVLPKDVAATGNQYFYVNGSDVYRVNQDGSNVERITSGSGAEFVATAGGELYIGVRSGNAEKVLKISDPHQALNNGSYIQPQLVHDFSDGNGMKDLTVVGGKIYVARLDNIYLIEDGLVTIYNASKVDGITYHGGALYSVSVQSDALVKEQEVSAPLPVALLDFDVHSTDLGPMLTWKTATERNNWGFHIQRSLDGRNWSDIGFVESNTSNGNSDVEQSYGYVDRDFDKDGTVYYRLVQEDWDGAKVVHSTASVELEGNSMQVKIYPNPAGQFVNVQADKIEDVQKAILTNTLGQQFELAVEGGRIDLSDQPNGRYFLQFAPEHNIPSQQLIIQHQRP